MADRMPGEDEVSALIAQAYDAALGRESWPALLGRLADLLGGDSAATLHPAGAPLPRDGAVRIRIDPDRVPLYNAHYHATWPVLPALPRLPAVFVDGDLHEAPPTTSNSRCSSVSPRRMYVGMYW